MTNHNSIYYARHHYLHAQAKQPAAEISQAPTKEQYSLRIGQKRTPITQTASGLLTCQIQTREL